LGDSVCFLGLELQWSLFLCFPLFILPFFLNLFILPYGSFPVSSSAGETRCLVERKSSFVGYGEFMLQTSPLLQILPFYLVSQIAPRVIRTPPFFFFFVLTPFRSFSQTSFPSPKPARSSEKREERRFVEPFFYVLGCKLLHSTHPLPPLWSFLLF